MQGNEPLPEKVVQFGTGILLRGLPDFFIDKANQQGIFNGRVLVIKSTDGPVDEFVNHQCRFTTCVRGIHKGRTIEENSMNSALSRVISAQKDWPEILKAATSTDLRIILSNTTEVGIRFEPESIFLNPPHSFPGKLTAFLYERFQRLGTKSPDLAVVPTELLPDNGIKLYEVVLKLAAHNQLKDDFTNWLKTNTVFCNSLVDRIVTKPSDQVKQSLGTYNELTIQTEPYKLWAVEGDERVKKILTFAAADPDVIITSTIEGYRERKLRLLNGTHTLTACFGFLKGRDTVYECMEDASMSAYVERVMLNEIDPTLPTTAKENSHAFALDVLDRFRNPYTVHRLLSITLQGTAKMKMRNIPTLLRYVEQFKALPELLVRGFAAHLVFMKAVRKEGTQYFGDRRGLLYPIQDDQAGYFYELWQGVHPSDKKSLQRFVTTVCENTLLWEADLKVLPGFVERVTEEIEGSILDSGR